MPADDAAQEPTASLIETSHVLAAAWARWRRARVLALDTEFERSRTYYPRPALIQVADGRRADLVDPLAVRDLDPLRELLADERIIKVLHSAGEDLEIFHRLCGTLPWPLFDTQLAAAFAGYGYGLGYRRLVSELCGVALPKDATRSDWLQRPLSPAQVRYAALDVAYLVPIHARLREELRRTGREAWAQSDFARLLDLSRLDPDPELTYRRIRGAWQLDSPSLARLQALAAWRERESRRRDRPRAFVLSDATLLVLARRSPQTLRDLRGCGVHPRLVERSGRAVLRCLSSAPGHPADSRPPVPPLAREHTRTVTRLKTVVRARAAELGLAPELLAPRESVEALVKRVRVEGRRELPEVLQGWRAQNVGEALLAALEAD